MKTLPSWAKTTRLDRCGQIAFEGIQGYLGDDVTQVCADFRSLIGGPRNGYIATAGDVETTLRAVGYSQADASGIGTQIVRMLRLETRLARLLRDRRDKR